VKKRTKRITKKLPNIKKDIKGFLLDEEGKIDKKNLAKLGLSMVALKMMLQPGTAFAGHTSHQSVYDAHSSGPLAAGHSSNAPHTSYTRHANHSSGGWC